MSHYPALRVADLSQNSPTPFDLTPDSDALSALASELELLDLRKLRFSGEIKAQGKRDWRLKAKLGATVTQPCVVSLDPVTTRIDLWIERTFLSDWDTPEDNEVEMSEDDTIEPLGTEIDVAAIMAESLALNLPVYPRKAGVALGESVHADPGVQPLTDDDVKPFAGLAALKDALNKDK
ncbi:DUF177 domain-containing protein [Aliisedimentitalea scapharcae]|uniref:DUF177 domain-containing protein n=1 Tax=Aliisedimentitalea scapharcae TaxID=1524259 RepID=A0ABZ2XLW9_9RHOB|nr:DUF177 domain-containing protein [Rhodobacteraceae bacterium M382]